MITSNSFPKQLKRGTKMPCGKKYKSNTKNYNYTSKKAPQSKVSPRKKMAMGKKKY